MESGTIICIKKALLMDYLSITGLLQLCKSVDYLLRRAVTFSNTASPVKPNSLSSTV